MILQFPLIVALVRVLGITGQPMQCAAIYTVLSFCFGLLSVMGGLATFPVLLLWTAARFAMSAAYFQLLHDYSDSGTWWVVLPFGALVSYF